MRTLRLVLIVGSLVSVSASQPVESNDDDDDASLPEPEPPPALTREQMIDRFAKDCRASVDAAVIGDGKRNGLATECGPEAGGQNCTPDPFGCLEADQSCTVACQKTALLT
jgi:hypothetical protein